MNMKIEFDHSIVGIDENNIRDKIAPYVEEVCDRLVKNGCKNVKITTKIRILSGKDLQILIAMSDTGDL